MLRGLYEFRPINEKTLGFQTNDILLFLEPHARDKNWLRVADSNGNIGFVPVNFIEIHRETTSEKLVGFLDEAIRRARRDRIGTVELLGSVRQNILTSPYTTEEHMTQIEREVSELRARAISELNYDPDYRRNYKGQGGAQQQSVSQLKESSKHSSSSPRVHNNQNQNQNNQQQQTQQQHSHQTHSSSHGGDNNNQNRSTRPPLPARQQQQQSSSSSHLITSDHSVSSYPQQYSSHLHQHHGHFPPLESEVCSIVPPSSLINPVESLGGSEHQRQHSQPLFYLLPEPTATQTTGTTDQLKSSSLGSKSSRKNKGKKDIIGPSSSSCTSANCLNNQSATQYAEITVNNSASGNTSGIPPEAYGKLLGEYVKAPLLLMNPVIAPSGGGSGGVIPLYGDSSSLGKKKESCCPLIPHLAPTGVEECLTDCPGLGLGLGILNTNRRCSQQHCQKSMEHNCCCASPSCTKGGGVGVRGMMRPDPSTPLDTVTMGAEIVDIVRNATGLSHKLSQDATEVVLQYVSENIGGMPEELTKLLVHLERPRAVSQNGSVIARSPDAYNIRKIFNRLTQCKDDEQQRSWALHEDESMILENLQHLNNILTNCDASISKYVMKSDRYNSVNALVLYYQMETRWSIREKLVHSFAILCNIDEQALSILINSILPMELAREIGESGGNSDRMCVCGGLLTMLLSSGESMPITHYDHLGGEFLEFVFNVIEDPPNQDEKITDGFMNLLFAYNLQFESLEDNLIISTLDDRFNANVFTQKVIYYLNREVDPIDMFDHVREAPNSVLKLTTDVFQSKKAADLFYTNDIKVLIDIVTRCVTDLGPGDLRRGLYLKLIQVIVRNSNFSDHKHRIEDLHNCFMSILLEEDAHALPDQRIIKDIAQEFPAFFKTD